MYHLWYNTCTCCIKLLNVYFYVLEEHFSICKILHLIGFNSNKDEMLPDELDGTLLIYYFITAFCISNVWSFDKKFSEKSLDLIDICEPKRRHSGFERGSNYLNCTDAYLTYRDWNFWRLGTKVTNVKRKDFLMFCGKPVKMYFRVLKPKSLNIFASKEGLFVELANLPLPSLNYS